MPLRLSKRKREKLDRSGSEGIGRQLRIGPETFSPKKHRFRLVLESRLKNTFLGIGSIDGYKKIKGFRLYTKRFVIEGLKALYYDLKGNLTRKTKEIRIEKDEPKRTRTVYSRDTLREYPRVGEEK